MHNNITICIYSKNDSHNKNLLTCLLELIDCCAWIDYESELHIDEPIYKICKALRRPIEVFTFPSDDDIFALVSKQ